MAEVAKCEICGEPMPEGEEVFKFHGYSGSCPKPPLKKTEQLRTEEPMDRAFEAKYTKRCWRLHGGLLTGLVVALPEFASRKAEVYHHRLPDGRVFEYEFRDHDILQFLREVPQS